MSTQSRRKFLQTAGAFITAPLLLQAAEDHYKLVSVTGELPLKEMDFILPHEHIMVDFIGAAHITKDRYNPQEVYDKALPKLLELRKTGCTALFDCTPAYLGRDAVLLKKLSQASGIAILTNTGYYGAAKEKYLPQQVFTEDAATLAKRWINECENGIEHTGIKPGFIKLGVDEAPLTDAQQKIIHAGALTHLQTGLTIAVHTGNGKAAGEELDILTSHKVNPDALVWVHAQNEQDFTYFTMLGKQGVWVQFDGVNKDNLQQYLIFLQHMKTHQLLNRTLVSQDSGWYHVGEAGGGNFNGYTDLFVYFIPLLKQHGFTNVEINQVFKKNPIEAYRVSVRKRNVEM